MEKRRGQGSTEYLVILGAVLLISMVTVIMVGGSQSSGISVKEQQSQSYWKSGATPFSISTVKVTNSSVALSVSNALIEPIYLTAVEVEDDSGNNATIMTPNQMFNAGEQIDLSNYSFSDSSNPCVGKAAGSEFEFKVVSFIYTQGSISGIRQQGTQPLVGTCSALPLPYVVATISVGTYAHGVAVTPDGAYAYITNEGSHTVSVIATASNTVADTIQVGSYLHGVAIAPDGAYAYVANGNDAVSVINTSDNTVVTNITVDSGPHSIAVTPDSAYAYVTNSGGN